MSPRRPPRREAAARSPLPRIDVTEVWAGEEFVVRPITGAASTKTYRCPGCDHEIKPATPHVVVWPVERPGGADDRRHWHTACWRARDRRRPR